MKLNCDLGESYGSWRINSDAAAMPHIDQANIACGYHAGDPLVMQSTLRLAKEHGVSVGAHPAYPDLQGFGRRSMNCSAEEITAYVAYQIAALEGMAVNLGLTMDYVKPHGALYNDMMLNPDVRGAVMQAVANHHSKPVLMLQSLPEYKAHQAEADMLGLMLYFEVFADRRYEDDGRLMSRRKPGAVLEHDEMIKQVEQLCRTGVITSAGGKALKMPADSLCVHGDNEAGVKAMQQIRGIVDA